MEATKYKRVTSAERSSQFREHYLTGILAMIDMAVFVLLGMVTYAIYPGWNDADAGFYIGAVWFAAIVTVSAFNAANLYRIEHVIPTERVFIRSVSICVLVFLVMFFIGFVFKITDEYSRIWLIGWVSLVVVTLSAVRVYMGHIVHKMAKKGQLSRKVIVMGRGREAQRLFSRLEQTAFPWIHVIGVFDASTGGQAFDKRFLNGDVDDLLDYARRHQIDDIIIALPGLSEEHLRVLINKLEVLPVNINLSLDLVGVSLDEGAVSAYGRLPVVNMKMRPLEGWRQMVKFLEDRILGLIIFSLIAPIMAVIALLIKLDSPGPIFFKQDRYGFNNQLIKVYKFRTMYSDQTDANAEKLATRDDSRITTLGRFLRRSSLDELPQFINVLKGDMSIVGPRPHALKASAAGRLYDEVVDNYAKRHRVKPGITGWAQVRGWRGETDTEEKIMKRVEYDLDYIEHWSLSFDLKIILQTIFGGFSGRNAF